MYKKKQLFITISLTIILLLSQIIYPIATFAETIDSRLNEPIQLFQFTEAVHIDDEAILINEETFLYGIRKGNNIHIQFEDTYIKISSDSVKEITIDDNSPKFIDEQLMDEEKQSIPKETVFYSIESDDRERLIINKELEYPVVENELGLQVIYLGNVEFYFNESDRNVALEKKEATEEENSENKTDEMGDTTDKGLEDHSNDSDHHENKVLTGKTPAIESPVNGSDKLGENNHKQEEEAKKRLTNINHWQDVTSNYFKVTSDNLIVYDNRSGPLKPIGKLTKGQVYPRVSDYGNWHRIQYGNIYGYVMKAGTKPDNGNVLQNKNTNYKNQIRSFKAKKDIIVYDNSSGKLTPYGIINKNQTYPIATDYGRWYRIIYTDRVGYVKKSEVQTLFTKSDKYFKAETNSVIYDNRGGKLKNIGNLVNGQVYPRVSDYGNWHRIQFGNIYGYVRKSETSYASGSNIKNINKNYKPLSQSFIARETVIVYDNSFGRLQPFGQIEKGVTFPIVSDYGENWWRVIYADRIGYVKKSEVNYTYFDKYFKADMDTAVYDNRGGKLKNVGKLKKGQVYPRVSDYGNWHRIQFGNIYGYVRKSETSPASGSGIKNINKNYKHQSRFFTALETVTIYDNSLGKLQPFGQIDKGTTFPIATDYGNWWRVIYADRIGFVHKDQVKAQIYATDKYFRTIRDTEVYDNRSGKLKKVGELYKGQAYPVESSYGNWWRVQFGDFYGYVRKADTGFATKSEIKNVNEKYRNSINKIITNQRVIIYDNSSGKLVPFGKLEPGTSYPIAFNYGNWVGIIYLDRIGFVHKNYVQEDHPLNFRQIVKEYRNKNTTDNINRLNQFFISPTEGYVMSANNMLRNQYKISTYGTFNFSKGIPWGTSPDGNINSRSYYRALHGHFFINDLIAAYKVNGNKQYIHKGYDVIYDWITKNPYGDAQHSMAWHDEGTARRLITWVNFYEVARNVLNDEQLDFLLKNMFQHADLLLTDNFYSKNTNHGMFQDEALIVFSDYFDQVPKQTIYHNTAKQRMKEYFNYIVSKEGVHLEHSPAYHQLIAFSIKGYSEYFKHKDQTESAYYSRLYNSMAEYYTWVIKPDGNVPLIGDTFSTNLPNKNIWKENEYYQYARSVGREGIKPEGHSKVFKDSGYAIFRDDWEKGINSTYIHFTAAYHTKYHKHSDDLSVWIYANGHDIVTEAGPNGYDYHLPFTEFAYSSFAHNTLIVNNRGLPRIDGKYNKTYIENFLIDDYVSSVTGVNKRYENVTHRRNLVYDRSINRITVKDTVHSTRQNNYKILWNLAEGVEPKIDGNIINLFINGVEVMSIEVNSTSNINIQSKKGQRVPYLLGWHIKSSNNPVETNTIVIETNNANAEITSVFSVKE